MIIISAFPGTGKTTFTKNVNQSMRVTDSDSSQFPKDNFPANYIEHIKSLKDQGVNVCFVSSHKAVREALVAEGLDFYLVYPNSQCKEEYMTRYRNRGNDNAFLELMENNFELFVEDCRKQTHCIHVVLGNGGYIVDAMESIQLHLTEINQ